MPYAPLSKSTTSEDQQSVTDEPNNGLKKPHPSPSPGNSSIQTILIVILTLGMGFGAGQWWATSGNTIPSSGPQTAPRSRRVPVRLLEINTTSLEDTSEFVGTLEAKRSVDVRAEVEGRVTQLFIQAGDFVEPQQAIARLDSDELETNLRGAQANLVRARARLAELKAGSRPEEIAQAQAKLMEAQAELTDAQSGSFLAEINQGKAQIDAAQAAQELAKKRVERFQTLSQEGAIPRDQFDTLLSARTTAKANLAAAQRRLEQLEKNRQAEIALRRAVVQQEEQALQQLRNGTRREEIEQAEAQVAEAVAAVRRVQVLMQETIVKASFSGVIGDVLMKVGDYVREGDTVTTLTENQQLELRLPIPLEHREDLRLGLPVNISDPKGDSLGIGSLSFISPTVNPDSQTILAKATLDNSNYRLRDGQFVKATVIWNQQQNRIVIPLTAVTFQGKEQFVYVAEGNETLTAKKQPIQLGLIQGDRAEVLTGLKPGKKLIISGIQRLSDGVEINPL